MKELLDSRQCVCVSGEALHVIVSAHCVFEPSSHSFIQGFELGAVCVQVSNGRECGFVLRELD